MTQSTEGKFCRIRYSQQQIADDLGISRNTLGRDIKKFKVDVNDPISLSCYICWRLGYVKQPQLQLE